MVWAPKYGLKGMIDASVRVKNFSNGNHIDEKMMPLEFKTGKATSGQTLMEHTAQLILYILLMSERYSQSIDSGLLYYLSTNLTMGINCRRSDLIGIIMRRNELAHDIMKASMAQQLPQMLKTLNMCKGCRHLNSCTIYHKVVKTLILSGANISVLNRLRLNQRKPSLEVKGSRTSTIMRFTMKNENAR